MGQVSPNVSLMPLQFSHRSTCWGQWKPGLKFQWACLDSSDSTNHYRETHIPQDSAEHYMGNHLPSLGEKGVTYLDIRWLSLGRQRDTTPSQVSSYQTSISSCTQIKYISSFFRKNTAWSTPCHFSWKHLAFILKQKPIGGGNFYTFANIGCGIVQDKRLPQEQKNITFFRPILTCTPA